MTLILTGPGQTAVHRMTEFTLHGVPEADEDAPVVTVIGPAGLTTAMPAFRRHDQDGTGWRVRFAPPLPGHWHLSAACGVDLSPPLVLQVEADPVARGGVHVREGEFRFESGEPFLPLGADLGPLADAPRRLAELAEAGATVTRVAAQPPGLLARQLDQVLDRAAEHGIAVLLDLPAAAWTLYAGARWAAHPALFAWSAPGPEWTPLVQAIDPYGRPILGEDFEIGSTPGDRPVLHDADGSPWAAIFSGFAGHLADVRFHGLRAFLAGEHLGALTPTAAGAGLALTSPTRALLWLASTSSSTSDGSVTVGGLAPGAYTATWCSTADGSTFHQDEVVAAAGIVRLAVPPLLAEAAVRLEPLPSPPLPVDHEPKVPFNGVPRPRTA